MNYETPMIRIKYKYNEKVNWIYAKLEYFNITGSIKDRIAKYIIDKAIHRKELKPNMPIIETSSGNTGIAITAYAAKLGYKTHIFIPKHMSKERIKLIKSYGGNVHLIKTKKNAFKKCIKKAKEFAKQNNGYLTLQFDNNDNVETHYKITTKEILKQLPNKPDIFISGIGTGGTITGIGNRLKKINKDIEIYAIEPDKKKHHIEGISDGITPKIMNDNLITENIKINSNDAIIMAQKLAKELGLGVGISSGANFLGAALKNKRNKKIIIIFPDDNKKYLSTKYSKTVKNRKNYISNNIELISYQIV